MSYQLFLFDLDDTLLDFKASERLSFYRALEGAGLDQNLDDLFESYQLINHSLWQLFEAHASAEDLQQVFRPRLSRPVVHLGPHQS